MAGFGDTFDPDEVLALVEGDFQEVEQQQTQTAQAVQGNADAIVEARARALERVKRAGDTMTGNLTLNESRVIATGAGGFAAPRATRDRPGFHFNGDENTGVHNPATNELETVVGARTILRQRIAGATNITELLSSPGGRAQLRLYADPDEGGEYGGLVAPAGGFDAGDYLLRMPARLPTAAERTRALHVRPDGQLVLAPVRPPLLRWENGQNRNAGTARQNLNVDPYVEINFFNQVLRTDEWGSDYTITSSNDVTINRAGVLRATLSLCLIVANNAGNWRKIGLGVRVNNTSRTTITDSTFMYNAQGHVIGSALLVDTFEVAAGDSISPISGRVAASGNVYMVGENASYFQLEFLERF